MCPTISAFVPHAPIVVHTAQQRKKWAQRTRVARLPSCVAKSFDDAVNKGIVKHFGRTIQLDQDGHYPLHNDLQISSDLRRKLQPVVDVILREDALLGIRAIFVRGSVATGNFLSGGRSDLDLIVISRNSFSRLQTERTNLCVSNIVKAHLGLSGADIRFTVQGGLSHASSMNATGITHMLLNQYSVLLYGEEIEFSSMKSNQMPVDDIAMNIRKDERSFKRLFEKGARLENVSLQINAIQWICKRILRAVADVSSQKTKQHSRDLVPCYKLGSQAFPEYAEALLLCLQMACASPENNYAELSRDGFIVEGSRVVENLVEVVEDLFLRFFFGECAQGEAIIYSTTAPHLLPSRSFAKKCMEILTEATAALRSKATSMGQKRCRPRYQRSEVPQLALQIRYQAHEENSQTRGLSPLAASQTTLHHLLREVSSPIVHSAVGMSERERNERTAEIIGNILETNISVDCRVSPNNIFIFCRASHQWIENSLFEPPSILLSLDPEEALRRMQVDCNLPPLYYANNPNERIYIQTKARQSQQLFTAEHLKGITIAQEERIWVSTHGSVSGLHFDACYSVLVQRTGAKRMIFFPPICLEHMGIYPLGHPLHRRARVNLAMTSSFVFSKFWEECSSRAIEVYLKAGDAVVFPPFWVHYTESLATEEEELSISHTLRYLQMKGP